MSTGHWPVHTTVAYPAASVVMEDLKMCGEQRYIKEYGRLHTVFGFRVVQGLSIQDIIVAMAEKLKLEGFTTLLPLDVGKCFKVL